MNVGGQCLHLWTHAQPHDTTHALPRVQNEQRGCFHLSVYKLAGSCLQIESFLAVCKLCCVFYILGRQIDTVCILIYFS